MLEIQRLCPFTRNKEACEILLDGSFKNEEENKRSNRRNQNLIFSSVHKANKPSRARIFFP
jgi:hypothetical protein